MTKNRTEAFGDGVFAIILAECEEEHGSAAQEKERLP